VNGEYVPDPFDAYDQAEYDDFETRFPRTAHPVPGQRCEACGYLTGAPGHHAECMPSLTMPPGQPWPPEMRKDRRPGD
jgi:hypothetical protein